MSSSDAHTLQLRDGRTLGYAEYGSPHGTPLLYFHGFPMSRLEASALHGMASRREIRLLSLDRPGFGLSTYDPHRRITDWPADVQAFATQLGLSRFSILGCSGGGPYALACAKELPAETLDAVGVLAGAPVWDGGFRTKGVPWYSRLLYLSANYWPSGTRVVTSSLVGMVRWIVRTGPIERRIDGWLEAMTKEKETAGEGERETTPLTATSGAREEVEQEEPPRSTAQRREELLGLLFDGFAQGAAGFVYEAQLLSRDWGFKFEDVTYHKVQMWHGSRDANAPVRTIRDMARRMPHCVLKEYDDTHFSMGYRLEEVLEQLIPSQDERGNSRTEQLSQTRGV